MLRSWLFAIALALTFCSAPMASVAQTTTGAPAGLSKDQFDQLVDAISKSVVQKLKDERSIPDKPIAVDTQKPAAAEPEVADSMAREMGDFVNRGERVLAAYPGLWRNLKLIPSVLDGGPTGRGLFFYLIQLGVAVALAVAAEGLTRRFFAKTRARLAAGSVVARRVRGLSSLAGLAALDLVGLAAVWLVSYGAIGAWFPGSDPQARLAGALLASIFSWRLYLFAFRIILRPDEPEARLASMSDAEAARCFVLLSNVVLTVIGVSTVLRILIAIKTPQESVAAGQLLANALILWAFISAALKSRDAVAHWLGTLANPGSLASKVGRNWLVVAIPFFCLLVAAQIFGAISARFQVPAAMLLTLNTVIAVLLLETLIKAVLARVHGEPLPVNAEPAPHAAAAHAAIQAPPRVADVVARCIHVLILLGAVLTVSQTWIVNVLGIIDAGQWKDLTRASVRTGATLFFAFVAWEIVKLVSDRYVARHPAGAPHDEDAEHEPGSSRLATLMPLMRVALAIVIGVLAILIVLSEMGVNVTPLIAGASVFGLAISFGSQTLVRDIVSGIFYLTDDAFRIGEYIDCGKAKGTVEGFTLRSLKLRHQNGQVHTIPFGQLGQITNFSRDWTTVKFNLRFARDTDVEKLRKATKKIGVEMMEDPEIKPEILEPLKMQGVADIADQALIVRFKFTVRPGKPSFIQRNAIKRMVSTFPEMGIQFANATVSVQTFGGGQDQVAGGAAATLARIQAEAAATANA